MIRIKSNKFIAKEFPLYKLKTLRFLILIFVIPRKVCVEGLTQINTSDIIILG